MVLRTQANGQGQKKSHKWISKAKVNSSAHMSFQDEGGLLNAFSYCQSGFSIIFFKLPPFHHWHSAQAHGSCSKGIMSLLLIYLLNLLSLSLSSVN